MAFDADVLKIVGQIAGIGGISLGVLLFIFRGVIKKDIFPLLKKDHAYKLLRLLLLLTWSIAIIGIIAWIVSVSLSQVQSLQGATTSSEVQPIVTTTPPDVSIKTAPQSGSNGTVDSNIASENAGYTVSLILPSKMSGAKILVDGKPARVIKQTPTVVTIFVQATQDNHYFVAKKDDVECSKMQTIQNNNINITVCE